MIYPKKIGLKIPKKNYPFINFFDINILSFMHLYFCFHHSFHRLIQQW